MKRITRRYLANLVFFASALLLILRLNRDQNHDSRYAWTTVRYKTRLTTPLPAHGVCPGLASTTKPALVVARVAADGDASWLDPLAEKYHLCIYTADDTSPTHLHPPRVPANRAHEAMPYLTFLIDNYASLPSAGAVFVHGSRRAWHNDDPNYDNAALLAALNVTAALASDGYANLRCDWSAGTCSATSKPQRSLETALGGLLEPWNARTVSDAALPNALAVLFGEAAQPVLLSRSDVVRAQCCAQFAVSRAAVWRHAREEYVAVRDWLLDGAAPADDRVAGRILSYVWHVLFLAGHSDGEEGVVELTQLNTRACPRADECYCRLYGRCGLEGCDGPGECRGQYRVPLGYRVPPELRV